MALNDQIRIWRDKPHGENQGQKWVRIWRDKPHGENQGQKWVMCLDGWEIYETKERLVDDHYEFVTHPIV